MDPLLRWHTHSVPVGFLTVGTLDFRRLQEQEAKAASLLKPSPAIGSESFPLYRSKQQSPPRLKRRRHREVGGWGRR